MVRTRHLRNGERCGFTLVELLVVMTLIGVLIFAAIPMFDGEGAAKLRASVRRAGSLFEQARSLALTRSEPVRVMVLEDPSDEDRHRREMAIAVPNGEAWEIAWGPESLPDGVIFDVSQAGVPTRMMEVESGVRGARSYRYFAIRPNGTFSGAEPNFVVALGFIDGGSVVIPNGNRVDGFRITAAARPFYFRTPAEISNNLPDA